MFKIFTLWLACVVLSGCGVNAERERSELQAWLLRGDYTQNAPDYAQKRAWVDKYPEVYLQCQRFETIYLTEALPTPFGHGDFILPDQMLNTLAPEPRFITACFLAMNTYGQHPTAVTIARELAPQLPQRSPTDPRKNAANEMLEEFNLYVSYQNIVELAVEVECDPRQFLTLNRTQRWALIKAQCQKNKDMDIQALYSPIMQKLRAIPGAEYEHYGAREFATINVYAMQRARFWQEAWEASQISIISAARWALHENRDSGVFKTLPIVQEPTQPSPDGREITPAGVLNHELSSTDILLALQSYGGSMEDRVAHDNFLVGIALAMPVWREWCKARMYAYLPHYVHAPQFAEHRAYTQWMEGIPKDRLTVMDDKEMIYEPKK